MEKNLKDQDVLLVKEKGSNELKAVAGISPTKEGEEKKIESLKPVPENRSVFMKFNKHDNIVENFIKNFVNQLKDPTRFIFFKAPADKVEESAKALEKALENPENPQNKQFLDMHKVWEQAQNQEKEFKIQINLVVWKDFEKYGVTLDDLEKSGNTGKLLDYRKTDLMTITLNLGEETLRTDGRFSLRKQEDGTFTPKVHPIRHKADLERPYFGIKFTDEDKQNLLTTGNLGRIVEAEFKQGEKTPVLLSLDKLTNELVSYRKEWLNIPDMYKGVTLSEGQKQQLGEGKAVRVEDMISKKGKPFSADVQFNADKRFFELRFDNGKKQEQETGQTAELYIPNKILGVDLTKGQHEQLKAGEAVYVSGMKNQKGEIFNSYIKVNPEENKLKFYKENPDNKQTQGEQKQPAEPKKATKHKVA